jgi:hypothetical protein
LLYQVSPIVSCLSPAHLPIFPPVHLPACSASTFVMDPASIPLSDTPNASDATTPQAESRPYTTDAVLSASSIVQTAGVERPSTLLAQLRPFATATATIVVPPPVRKEWRNVYLYLRDKINVYPPQYRYGALLVFLLALGAEWEQPGCFPRPRSLTNALVSTLCAGLLIVGIVILQDFTETNKWPWQEEGWVWPWEALLWSQTVYDFGASTYTSPDGFMSPLPSAASPVADTPTQLPNFDSQASKSKGGTPMSNIAGSNTSMPPPATIKQPIIIPPTPQLPRGLRPIHLPPPTPADIHKSGLLGESPRAPPQFKHFSGDFFHRNAQKLEAIREWSKPGSSALLVSWEEEEEEEEEKEEEENSVGRGRVQTRA